MELLLAVGFELQLPESQKIDPLVIREEVHGNRFTPLCLPDGFLYSSGLFSIVADALQPG